MEDKREAEQLRRSWIAFWQRVMQSRQWDQEEQVRMNLFGGAAVSPASVSKWIKRGTAPGPKQIAHLLGNRKFPLDPEEQTELCKLSLWHVYGKGSFPYFASLLVVMPNGMADVDAVGIVSDVGGVELRLRSDQAQLNAQVWRLTEELRQANDELVLRRREAQWVQLLDEIDQDMFILLSTSAVTAQQAERFSYRLFQGACAYFSQIAGGKNVVHRAGVYTPMDDDPDYLVILWDKEVGGEAKLFNRWYIGPNPDPTDPQRRRGIPGTVFCEKGGIAVPDVLACEFFVNPYPDQREPRYKSLVQAVITSPDGRQKLGVLSFDSQQYLFSDHDLQLVRLLAARIGCVMAHNVPFTRDQPLAFQEETG